MKKLFVFLIIAGIAVGGYFYINQQDESIEIVQAEVELQQVGGGMNFETPSVTGLRFAARIKGSAKNISTKELRNITLTYKLGNQTVTAKIPSIAPGAIRSFTTNKYETKNKTPKFELTSLTYDSK